MLAGNRVVFAVRAGGVVCGRDPADASAPSLRIDAVRAEDSDGIDHEQDIFVSVLMVALDRRLLGVGTPGMGGDANGSAQRAVRAERCFPADGVFG